MSLASLFPVLQVVKPRLKDLPCPSQWTDDRSGFDLSVA